MDPEPPIKRAVAFVDGQNLFHAAREAIGYTYPNYDISALAEQVCTRQGWKLAQVRFDTGIPDAGDNPGWHAFWAHKLAAMGRRGVVVFSRPLRYRNRRVTLSDGSPHSFLTGEEKGIDVRIALAHRREYDVVLLFSQDQDLSEVAQEIRTIAREQRRWIKIAMPSLTAQPAGTTGGSIRPTGSGSTERSTSSASTVGITAGRTKVRSPFFGK